jgi:hypothetical protein
VTEIFRVVDIIQHGMVHTSSVWVVLFCDAVVTRTGLQ